MNFSVVLPSRGVLEPVKKMLDSFETTTKDKSNLEVLIAIDEGKTDIIPFVKDQNYSFKIEFYERPVCDDFTNNYYNFLALKSTGDNVLGFNDDAWMITQDWDEKVLERVKRSGWLVYDCEIHDTAQIKYKHTFPCFVMISRAAINALGFFLVPELRMFPSDKIIYELYQHVGRIIPVPDVMIEHDHIPEHMGTKDRMMRIFHEDMQRLSDKPLNMAPYVQKLLSACAKERQDKEQQ